MEDWVLETPIMYCDSRLATSRFIYLSVCQMCICLHFKLIKTGVQKPRMHMINTSFHRKFEKWNSKNFLSYFHGGGGNKVEKRGKLRGNDWSNDDWILRGEVFDQIFVFPNIYFCWNMKIHVIFQLILFYMVGKAGRMLQLLSFALILLSAMRGFF